MREKRLCYPTWYMLLKTPMKQPGTGLPQILNSAIRMTVATRKYTKTDLNFACPTGYFTIFDCIQKNMLTIRHE